MYAVEFTAKITDGKIHVPPQYQDRFHSDVKVILLNTEHSDITTLTATKEAKGFGALAHRANKDLWKLEESAWERAVVDNYDNS